MVDLTLLYPELIALDGLPVTLQNKLAISDLEIQSGISFSKWNEMKDVFERQGLYFYPCTIATQRGRHASVDLAIEQKLYILNLGGKGEKFGAFIEVDNLEQVISFLSVWLDSNKPISQLRGVEASTTFLDLEDDAQYIRCQWASRHRHAVNFPAMTGPLASLLYETMHDPVLNQITPYTSLTVLCLSRYTEFPFLSGDYPFAMPSYTTGYYYRYVIEKRNIEEAERLLLTLLPEKVGTTTKINDKRYELTKADDEVVYRSDPTELLEFIIDYTKDRYDVADRKENGKEKLNAKEAVEFLRNALPPDWHRSFRRSADDINSGK